ncbi:MAG: VWA domain-containing protein [Acidimicrobiia bacterium]|nr:VWA domain-containing protein [Acidimicrobiia bacterium]
MTVRRWWTGAAVAALGAATLAAQDERTFRSAVDIVSLSITVTDAASRYVTDLTQQDFQVFEDGTLQNISFFSRRQQPVALSLLLDSSASMEDKLPTLRTAAANFVRRLQPKDLAQIIDFDVRAQILQDFTASQDELESAIGRTAAGGSTSMYNAIFVALAEMKKIQARSDEDIRRQAVVVFSDGEDTSSVVSFEEVLDRARRSETAIYSIGLQSVTSAQNRGFQEAAYVMRQLAQETGGRAFFAKRIEDLDGVYSEIADELSSQYTIAYTPKNQMRNGAWRRIVVQVQRENATPRTKRGYYAPTAK